MIRAIVRDAKRACRPPSRRWHASLASPVSVLGATTRSRYTRQARTGAYASAGGLAIGIVHQGRAVCLLADLLRATDQERASPATSGAKAAYLINLREECRATAGPTLSNPEELYGK